MKNNLYPRKHRGTVIVLVVAVLALLAVLGTVFIVSARTERNSAHIMSANVNWVLAENSAINIARQAMIESILDQNGNIGGYGTLPAANNAQAARTWDYPEQGTTLGYTTYNTHVRDEAWLVKNLYNTLGTDYSHLTDKAYNPSTGAYDLTNTTYLFDGTVTGGTNVVNDPASTAADAYINLLPFSDSSGIRYRVGFRILDTNRMANINTGSTDDTESLNDKTGTNISSYRLAPPTSVGTVSTTMTHPSEVTPTSAKNLHETHGALTVLARNGTSGAAFSASNWEQQILNMDAIVNNSISSSLFSSSFFDLTDELELRTRGNYGSLYNPRPAAGQSPTNSLWPNTFGNHVLIPISNTIVENPRRGSFTTYSWASAIRPGLDPDQSGVNVIFTCNGNPTWPYQAHPSSTTTVNRVPVNAPLGNNPLTLAQLATSLATSMIYTADKDYANRTMQDSSSNPIPISADGTTPFTQDEVCAYTVNFIESRWSGMVLDPSLPFSAYYFPSGPSFIDDQGICVRGGTVGTTKNYTGTNDLKAPSGRTYLGYVAQPFLNEVAVYGSAPDATTPTTVLDIAIELFNPYSTPLSLNGFKVKIYNQTPLVAFPANAYIPAHSFYILHTAGGHFASVLPTGIQHGSIAITIPAPAGQPLTVALYRPYLNRLGTTVDAEIDKTDFTNVASTSIIPSPFYSALTPGVPAEKSWSRDNFTPNAALVTPWGAAYEKYADATKTTSLGTLNGGTQIGHPLYERFAGTLEYSSATQQSPFVNVAEFNRIMRICHMVDTNGDSVAGNGLVMDHMYSIVNSPAPSPYSNMKYPSLPTGVEIESQLYFNFLARPEIYNSTPPTYAAPAVVTPQGDIRAVRLLDQLSFIDRLSVTSINIGNGGGDINKIRLPGQINVNTASGDVIRCIPAMTDQMVANILAYRDRPNASPGYHAVTSNTDYTVTTKYPGKGIRSLAELMVPITDASPSISSFIARDNLWASVYNLCTVRSDTFVVYGYLEAVRQNPSYTGTFDNSTQWYGTGASGVSDDSHANVPLLRVAKRHFIAIIDRSWCNYPRSDTANFALPRVVAIKDLPQ